MTSPRQNGIEETITETSDQTINSVTTSLSTTASIQLSLNASPSNSPTPNKLLESFLIIDEVPASQPPAIVNESQLIQTPQLSEHKKTELGVKRSCHTVNIVAYDENGCDIVFSPAFPNNLSLNNLPGNSNACYIFAADKKLYYADKQRKLRTPIPISLQDFDFLLTLSFMLKENFDIVKLIKLGVDDKESLFNIRQIPINIINLINQYMLDSSKKSLQKKLKVPTDKLRQINPDFEFILDHADNELLQIITAKTRHIHGMCFYKKKQAGSVMSPLEAVISSAYQFLGPRHFPSCFVVRNAENKDIGIISKSLPGFKPNRDKPLLAHELQISSLKNMIKERSKDDLEQLDGVISTLKKLIPLMHRDVNHQNSYFYQAWEFAKITSSYCLSTFLNQYSATSVKPQLEKFLLKNKSTITFGELEDLFSLLLNRKINIENADLSYVATQHKHKQEIEFINEILDKLALILLEETALFMKHLHAISRRLENEWVDIEAEKNDPGTPYHEKITEGILGILEIPLDDIIHYRINCGQAIGLTSRYFMKDHDGHANNLGHDGSNIDGDEAVNDLTYRFKNPHRKPGINDFILDKDDFKHFPNCRKIKFRYWPTVATIFDTSADAALSPITDLTKNYFTPQDNKNYQSLEFSAVFNFQKYIQLILFSIANQDMFSAYAALHMNENYNMLNDNGDVNAPLPLQNEKGLQQDVRTKWIENMTSRALEARQLTHQLDTVKRILARHSDFVLEVIQDNIKQFLDDKKMELKPQAFAMLQEVMTPEIIAEGFLRLREEILVESMKCIVGRRSFGM